MPKKKRSTKPALSMKTKVDRSKFVVESLDEMTPDIHYWRTRSVRERFEALHFLRLLNYGPAAAGRLQRVLEIVEKEPRSPGDKEQ
jgi:hypothetical protein